MKHTHLFNLIAGLALVVFTATGFAANDKLSKKLTDKAQGGGKERVSVIVQYHAKPGQAEDNRLNGLGATDKRVYGKLKMRSLKIKAKKLNALINDSKVKFVTLDSPVEGFTEAARLTANEPVSGHNNLYIGKAIGVAVIDSGVAGHDDVTNNQFKQYTFLNGAVPGSSQNTALVDAFGHGTHVAGIITGDGGESDNHRATRGLARDAVVTSLQVLDSDGRGNASDVIAALDWVLQYGDSKGIRVVNLSLGKGVETAAADDPLVQAAEAVWDAGIVVVASAGNYGRDGHFTITSPGNARKVITVGSLTDNETGTNLTDDFVSTYSSRGPTLHDHVLKPDLLAPGNRLVAPIPEVAVLRTDLADRVVVCDANNCNDDYLELSGTSMAAIRLWTLPARLPGVPGRTR